MKQTFGFLNLSRYIVFFNFQEVLRMQKPRLVVIPLHEY